MNNKPMEAYFCVSCDFIGSINHKDKSNCPKCKGKIQEINELGA